MSRCKTVSLLHSVMYDVARGNKYKVSDEAPDKNYFLKT